MNEDDILKALFNNHAKQLNDLKDRQAKNRHDLEEYCDKECRELLAAHKREVARLEDIIRIAESNTSLNKPKYHSAKDLACLFLNSTITNVPFTRSKVLKYLRKFYPTQTEACFPKRKRPGDVLGETLDSLVADGAIIKLPHVPKPGHHQEYSKK